MKRRKRFLVPEGSKGEHPPVAIYHVVTRVVDRRFVLEADEKEQLRILLRMYERFSGCRILSYCLMSNHLHVLLEVPPGCEKGESLGLSDEELLRRLGGLYSRNATALVEREIEAARVLMRGDFLEGAELTFEEREQNKRLGKEALEAIHVRYSYRMHSLSEFFKGMLQRFTCWFNREKGRRGTLWESRFRSVVVQDGLAARTMAAYIDLNPVRAGMVEDPADYRWSSYGEAVGGGRGAKKAQEGLVRAMYSFGDREASERSWAQGGAGKEYRRILIAAGMEQGEERSHSGGKQRVVARKGMDREKAKRELERLSKDGTRDLKISKVIGCRVRYFSDGAVIGSRAFVDSVFNQSRDLFGPKRKDGARKPRGALGELKGDLWSLRDLKT
ncbi:transposase [Akkermansiaceae bacterium]|nr:transposase [Akkermansiaceae bacterium]MDB4537087.1 transposase [Akkermansiaceae bacterium]